VAILCGT